ncbi:MAG: hypothetical protein ACK52V_02515, partial [Betaproteobacteria bacterium]
MSSLTTQLDPAAQRRALQREVLTRHRLELAAAVSEAARQVAEALQPLRALPATGQPHSST